MRSRSWFWLAMASAALSVVAGGQTTPAVHDARQHRSGSVVVLRPTAAAVRSGSCTARALADASAVIRRRLRLSGVETPLVSADPAAGTIAVTVPAGRTAGDVATLVARPAVLEFRYVARLDEGTWRAQPTLSAGRPSGFMTLVGRDGRPLPAGAVDSIFQRPPAFTGRDLMPTWRAEQADGQCVLTFEFKADRARAFEASTGAHRGKRLAIFLDRRLIGAPTIMQPMPGKGRMSCRLTLAEAEVLAAQLNSGALPFPLEVATRP